MPILYIPRGPENETLPDRRFAIQLKTKALLKHTTPNSADYKKIVSITKCFPITVKSFYSTNVNHRFSHFART